MIQYAIRHSGRSRGVRISVHGDGSVIVSAPKWINGERIARIVASKQDWIEKAVQRSLRMSAGLKLENETINKNEFALEVSRIVESKAKLLGAHPKKLGFRKMRSRWGSCSKEGNISINLLLGHLPIQLVEYVVVHELAHLAHHNHSREFWSLVAQYVPDYKSRKKLLNRYGYLLRH